MKAKQRPVAPEKSEAPNPRKRFRIDKLEERIAPKKGGHGTHKCWTQVCTDFGGGSIY
jgi:hypothetical protein